MQPLAFCAKAGEFGSDNLPLISAAFAWHVLKKQ